MRLLYLVSVFPALTETFVLREIDGLCRLGLECSIGQLRPIGSRPKASGFEHLAPLVVRGWEFWDARIVRSLLPVIQAIGKNLALLFRAKRSFSELGKLVYLVFTTAILSHKLRNQSVGHIRAHFLHTEAASAMLLSNLLGVPYSLTCHTTKNPFSLDTIRLIAKRAQFIVADTFQVRDMLVQLGVQQDRIRIIRNGVRLIEFSYSQPHSDHCRQILGVGRLDEKKGFHVLLEACAVLEKRNLDFQCIIVGDGAQRIALNYQVQTLGLNHRVKLIGNLSIAELKKMYEQSAVLAVPSIVTPEGETDGLPTVIIEAMATGIPVVGTKVAAIPEIITDRITGLLVEPGNSQQLADALEKCLRSSTLRRSLTSTARQLIEREYDLQQNLSSLIAMMESAVEQ